MRLLILLLPLLSFLNQAFEKNKTTDDFSYEITVNSPGTDSAKFNLLVTGFILAEDGVRTPFQLEKQDLKTPYKLNLKNGKYTVTVDSKSKQAVIVSKVQGIKNGNRVGSASGDSKKTILDFGFGGNYAARGE